MSASSLDKGTFRTISANQLHELAERGKEIELIDVRTPSEYGSYYIPQAQSEPLESLDPGAVIATRRLLREPLYVICLSGSRSEKVCKAFETAGYGDRVVQVEGGTVAWERAGYPLVHGRSVLPLDRQVRLATGLLILMGAFLGYLVDRSFFGISWLCGVGLVVAGITDVCPLGSVMARMPWNQGAPDSNSCER